MRDKKQKFQSQDGQDLFINMDFPKRNIHILFYNSYICPIIYIIMFYYYMFWARDLLSGNTKDIWNYYGRYCDSGYNCRKNMEKIMAEQGKFPLSVSVL